MEFDDAKILKYAPKIKFLVDAPGGGLGLPSSKQMPSDPVVLLQYTKNTALTFQTVKPVDSSALQPIEGFNTEHDYSAPVFFKPSIAEIITELPQGVLDKATAISIRSAGGGKLPGAFTKDQNRHLAEVRVYGGKVRELSRTELAANKTDNARQ